MTANAPKEGRRGEAPIRVPDVRRLPCPATPGQAHNITVHAGSVWGCSGCGKSWADLDAEVRASLSSNPSQKAKP